MQTESIPWPQGWAFYLLAIAELSFCHQLCPCSVWVRKKPWILLHLTNTRCSAQMSTFTSVAMFLSSVAAEKSDSSLKQTNEWLPWWLSGKESTCQCTRHMFHPSVGKIPWRRKWQSAPIFLLGKSHGQRSLAGYSPPGKKRVGHDLATKATATAMYGVVWHFSLPVHLNSLEASIAKAQKASCFCFFSSILNYPLVGDSSG